MPYDILKGAKVIRFLIAVHFLLVSDEPESGLFNLTSDFWNKIKYLDRIRPKYLVYLILIDGCLLSGFLLTDFCSSKWRDEIFENVMILFIMKTRDRFETDLSKC